VEVAPQQVRRATLDGKQVFESAPNELIALVFAHDPQSEQELRLRQALSAAIDRSSIRNVLLQGQGEAANSILPDWMTGYAFLFAQREPAKLTAAASPAVTMTLAYDAADPASQLIAQRVALNGRDAGVNLQPVPSPASADALLLSIPLPSANARVALAAVANSAGIALSPFQGTSPQELYARELQMLQSGRIIPLVHVPQAAAVSPNLQGWREDQFGEWHLEDVWLGAAKP
jgi:ABC-type transport system substrate-binding protein